MTILLIRTLKRLTAVEESLATFATLTFGSYKDIEVLDLDLSVYLVDDDEEQVTKVRTEHCASFSSPPLSHEASLTLHGFPVEIAEIPGATDFSFTRQQHREMRFIDNDELLKVAAVVKGEFERRQRFTTAEQMWEYINQRLIADDEEWRTLCDNRKKKKWKKWAATPLGQNELPGTEDV